MTGVTHEVRIATTGEEREAVFRHRYDVYVEELGRYLERADHVGRRLVDPEDEHSELLFATDGTNVVASLRTTWGGDGFSERQIEEYSPQPFLDELRAEVLNVGERTMISPAWRGTGVFADLAMLANEARGTDQVLVSFGACEPHLLRFYSQWQRPYAERSINHPESGFLIPLVSFPKGEDLLLGVGRGIGPTERAACVERVRAGTGAVVCSGLTDPAEYAAIVAEHLAAASSPLAELDGEELTELLAGSNVIRTALGDRIVRTAGTARTAYVVLAGEVTIRRSDGTDSLLRAAPGEIVGASAVLVPDGHRADVEVVADGTVVLALSERTVARVAEDRPALLDRLRASVVCPDA